ncbi:MAG: class II aldolase/adducin family protein [bacterium]
MSTVEKSGSPVSNAEWSARLQLAACYRIFDMFGWDELVFNHISLRVPGEESAFLINPFGLHYSEVCASNLLKIDINGEKLSESPYPVNKAGFVQHSVFHNTIADAHAIIHTHTTETMAVCSTREGLQPTNFYSAALAGDIAYHDFEGITVRPEEGERLIQNIGDKRVLLLRNHGPVVLGKTLPEAFMRYWCLQRACEIQLATNGAGEPVTIPQSVIEIHQRDFAQIESPEGMGVNEFEAMVRRVDKLDSSWRD